MRLANQLAVLATATLLAACQHVGDPASPGVLAETTPPPEAQTPTPEPAPEIASTNTPAPDLSDASSALPEPGSAQTPPPIPHIYMSFQLDNTGIIVSAIFAIDAARDNTPSDDPAIRLSPEDGRCNPQEMRNYTFPPKDAATPVVGEAERARGLSAGDLPAFLAVSVTDAMLNRGLAVTRNDTRPLNICTRKLWENLVLEENRLVSAAGQ